MRSYTMAEHCRCGGAILIDALTHKRTWSNMLKDFLSRHADCARPEPEDLSDRETAGFSDTTLANDHSEPELQIGFSRQWMHLSSDASSPRR